MKFIWTFLLSLTFVLSYAQKVSVSGIIVDETSTETVSGLKLIIDGEVKVMTDANGSFGAYLEKGMHAIRFEVNGKKQVIEINVKAEELDLGALELDFAKENKIKLDK